MSRKSQRAAELWSRVRGSCPLCGQPLSPRDEGLVCGQGHRFDLSRQGSVQLLAGRGNGALYDQALFAARRRMLELGLFTPALEAGLELLQGALGPGELWLDAGCGEGWATHYLAQGLPGRYALGLDLAPAGIRMAAAAWGGEQLWTVGDLARLPLADGSAAAVVNLLTPAHYGEFYRVLGPGGLLLKWVPGPEHLRQLREAAGVAPGEDSRAREFFEKNCRLLGSRRITAQITVSREDMPAAAAMAPFAQHRRERALEALAQREQLTLTADLTLLWGHVTEKRKGEGIL